MLSFKGIQVAPGVTLVGRPSVPGSAADAMLARRTTALRSLADVVVIVDRRGRVVDLVSHPTGLVLFPEGREFWVAIDGTEQARASFAFASSSSSRASSPSRWASSRCRGRRASAVGSAPSTTRR
jgi:hypothetical protein